MPHLIRTRPAPPHPGRLMIIPHHRLLLWVALITLPFSILGAVLPGAQIPALVLIALLLAAALVDGLLALNRLDGIRVELPDIIRLSKARPAHVQVLVHYGNAKPRTFRLGLPFPRHIEPDFDDTVLRRPDDGGPTRLSWPVRGLRRGRFPFTEARLECRSALGFWVVRGSVPSPAEFRVYPNLLTERRPLAGLLLRRGTSGVHARRQIGKGREFEKLRDYIPGDSFEDIHWKATAKRAHPVTKVFQIERTQEIYMVIDTSRLSARPVADLAPAMTPPPTDWNPAIPGESPKAEPALESYLTAALLLGLAAEQQGDLFGFLAFSDKIDVFLRARNGRAHYHACRDALCTLQPQPVAPDFDELATFVRMRLRRRALLVFLTALDDSVLAESFVRSAELIARQHILLVHMLRPPGARPLFSSADAQTVDDLYDRLGGHLRWHKLRELEKVLQRRGVRLALAEREELCSGLIARYLEVKRRQIL